MAALAIANPAWQSPGIVLARPPPPPSNCPAWCFTQENLRAWGCEMPECIPCTGTCADARARPLTYDHSFAQTYKSGSWNCRAQWPPRQFYVIFSMQRSASTTVCNVLNTLPGVLCAHDVLNRGSSVRPGSWQNLTRTDPIGAAMAAYEASAAVAGGKAACTWGFKLFPEHARNATLMEWLWPHLGIAASRPTPHASRAPCPAHPPVRP